MAGGRRERVADRFPGDFAAGIEACCAAGIEACCAAGGDMDTTAAIVGGMLTSYDPAVPPAWLPNREPLPQHAEPQIAGR